MHSSSIAQEYTFERLNNDNLVHLAQLYEVVYGRKARPGFYDKKYDTGYTGVSCVGYIAYDGQHEPIAYFGVIPCFIEYDGESILVAQAADAMTHSGHRYKGMLAELSRLTFALCRELGILLVFGFPNQDFYPAAMRMGWKETEALDRFNIPLTTFPLSSIAARWPFLKGWYRIYQRRVTARYVASMPVGFNTVLDGNNSGIQRSDAYLEYKKYNETVVLQIGHAKVWIKITQVLNVGEMAGVNEHNFDSVMHGLKKIGCRLGVRRISFQVSPHTALHHLWSSRYIPIRSFPVIFQDFGIHVPLEKIKFTFADIDIF